MYMIALSYNLGSNTPWLSALSPHGRRELEARFPVPTATTGGGKGRREGTPRLSVRKKEKGTRLTSASASRPSSMFGTKLCVAEGKFLSFTLVDMVSIKLKFGQ